jgi:hypothetical protein
MVWRKPREPARARGLHDGTTRWRSRQRRTPPSRRGARGDPPPGRRGGGRSARAQVRHRRCPVVVMLTTHPALLLRSHFSTPYRAESPGHRWDIGPFDPPPGLVRLPRRTPPAGVAPVAALATIGRRGRCGERGRVLGSSARLTDTPCISQQRSRPASDEMPRLCVWRAQRGAQSDRSIPVFAANFIRGGSDRCLAPPGSFAWEQGSRGEGGGLKRKQRLQTRVRSHNDTFCPTKRRTDTGIGGDRTS